MKLWLLLWNLLMLLLLVSICFRIAQHGVGVWVLVSFLLLLLACVKCLQHHKPVFQERGKKKYVIRRASGSDSALWSCSVFNNDRVGERERNRFFSVQISCFATTRLIALPNLRYAWNMKVLHQPLYSLLRTLSGVSFCHAEHSFFFFTSLSFTSALCYSENIFFFFFLCVCMSECMEFLWPRSRIYTQSD